MPRFLYVALASAACLLSGCALPAMPTYYPTGFATKLEQPTSPELKTTATGNILHRQKVALGRPAQLEAPLVIPTYSIYQRSYNVPTDALLYPGIFIDTKADGLAFCTEKPTAESHSLVGDTFKLRSCFSDPTRSGKFSTAYMMFNTLGETSTRTSVFAKGTVTWEHVIEPPIAYKPAEDAGKAQEVELAIRFEPGNSGPARLAVIQLAGLIEEELIGASVAIPTNKPFPFVLNVRSARIEVVDFKDGLLSYRVLAGFSPAKPFVMNLSADSGN